MARFVFIKVIVLVGLLGATAGASVQTCNTRCQTEQTDCNLRCDGRIPCMQQCQVTADSCADTCVKP